MTIAYHCPGCQKKLSLPTEAAGKRLKCPGCGTVFALPAAAPAAPRPPQGAQNSNVRLGASAPSVARSEPAGLPAAAAKNCPSCQAQLSVEAAICVNCGLDLRSGKKLHSPLPLTPSSSLPIVLIAGVGIGGIAVVMVGVLLGAWFMSRDAASSPKVASRAPQSPQVMPAKSTSAGGGDGGPLAPKSSTAAQNRSVQPISATRSNFGKQVTWRGRIRDDGQIAGDPDGTTSYVITLQLKAGSLPPAGTTIVFSGVLQPGVTTGVDYAYTVNGTQVPFTTYYLSVNEGFVISQASSPAAAPVAPPAGIASQPPAVPKGPTLPPNPLGLPGPGIPSPPLKTPPPPKAAVSVEVEWNGHWYAAEVIQTKDGKYFIHYTGYESNWDEWVGPERIRGLDGKGVAVAPKGPLSAKTPAAAEKAAAVQSIAASLATSSGKQVTWKGRVGKDGKIVGDSKGTTTYLITLKLKAGSLPAVGTPIVFRGILQPGISTGTDFVYAADGSQTAVSTVFLNVDEGVVVSQGAAASAKPGAAAAEAAPPPEPEKRPRGKSRSRE